MSPSFPNVATTPLAAIDALTARLDGDVVLDDLGRRCVTRDVARRLFAERAAAEVRQPEAWERNEARLVEQSERDRPWQGIPADQIPPGVAPAFAMLTAARDAQPRRQSVLQHALADRDGQIEFHSLGPEPE